MADRPYGRIRVRYDQADLLLRLLDEERHRVSTERFRWKNQADAIPAFNRAIALIDATLNELDRLVIEQEWEILNGQSRRENKKAPDPRTLDPGTGVVGRWDATLDGGGRGNRRPEETPRTPR